MLKRVARDRDDQAAVCTQCHAIPIDSQVNTLLFQGNILLVQGPKQRFIKFRTLDRACCLFRCLSTSVCARVPCYTKPCRQHPKRTPLEQFATTLKLRAVEVQSMRSIKNRNSDYRYAVRKRPSMWDHCVLQLFAVVETR